MSAQLHISPVKRPADIQRVEDGPVFITALADKGILKLLQKFDVQQIFVIQRFLTDNRLFPFAHFSRQQYYYKQLNDISSGFDCLLFYSNHSFLVYCIVPTY